MLREEKEDLGKIKLNIYKFLEEFQKGKIIEKLPLIHFKSKTSNEITIPIKVNMNNDNIRKIIQIHHKNFYKRILLQKKSGISQEPEIPNPNISKIQFTLNKGNAKNKETTITDNSFKLLKEYVKKRVSNDK